MNNTRERMVAVCMGTGNMVDGLASREVVMGGLVTFEIDECEGTKGMVVMEVVTEFIIEGVEMGGVATLEA